MIHLGMVLDRRWMLARDLLLLWLLWVLGILWIQAAACFEVMEVNPVHFHAVTDALASGVEYHAFGSTTSRRTPPAHRGCDRGRLVLAFGSPSQKKRAACAVHSVPPLGPMRPAWGALPPTPPDNNALRWAG